jgi:putative transposase
MILAHKIALDPTAAQAVYFARACGTSRFAWNWALARWKQEYALWCEYQCGPKPSEASLRRDLNAIKEGTFPWIGEVTKNAPQQAIKNLGVAFKNFFDGRAKYPTFKKKGVSRDSFRADNGTDKQHPNAVEVDGRRVKLPVIGWIRMRESVRFTGNIKSVTVSRVADRWFASFTVEIGHSVPVRETQAAVGVDLGVKALATLSDGSVFDGPKALRSNLKRLQRLSRGLSRKARGSANRGRARRKIARLHARIANIRRDSLHKLTSHITSRFSVIGIEDLNVRGMMANRSLARSIADVGMFEFRRQLGYKAAMRGCMIVVADRWFPSSKTCSDCGHVHADLALSDRDWSCDGCGVVHDRDHNAAINLEDMAASSAVSVCGAEGAGARLMPSVKPAAVKQKPTHGMFVYA